jgi:hypothetical protein
MYGVIDNNIFNGNHFDNYAHNDDTWKNTTFTYGSSSNLYYEDNIFNYSGSGQAIASGGLGGRYCYRYNTINVTGGNMYPFFDAHGNMGSGGNHGTMGVEVYGNKIVGDRDGNLLDLRGGRALLFYNLATDSNGISTTVEEEHCDGQNPPATAPDGESQHVCDAYYWNNRDQGGVVNPDINENSCGSYHITENVDWWEHQTNFNGTVGVGCGTLANRPSTCTTGVGYWATNQTCSSVSLDNVGRNPVAPLSGTLYRCTSTNTWTAYYTPFPYPHPLRGEGTAPNAPTGLRIVLP